MKKKPHRAQELCGFSLVEVTMAIGIAAVALIVLVGLLPTGLNTSRQGVTEEVATELLAAVSADIANADHNATTTPLFDLPLTSSTESIVYFDENNIRLSSPTDARFRLSIEQRSSANPALSILRLRISWPAQASASESMVETVIMKANPAKL